MKTWGPDGSNVARRGNLAWLDGASMSRIEGLGVEDREKPLLDLLDPRDVGRSWRGLVLTTGDVFGIAWNPHFAAGEPAYIVTCPTINT